MERRNELEAFKIIGEKERERKKSIAIINEAWVDFSLRWREREVRFASTITKLPRDGSSIGDITPPWGGVIIKYIKSWPVERRWN